MRAIPTIDRLMSRVQIDPETGCWNFIGSLSTAGYGQVRLYRQRRSAPTHRVTYEHFEGPIPHGLVLDHLCRNRTCCNPEHLEPVTDRENYLRGDRRSKTTHCPQGHPYDDANTYIHVNKQGQRRRHCRICVARRRADFNERKRA